ncbi:MAG: GPW/gp25 family protein [Chitinophagales bacterium]
MSNIDKSFLGTGWSFPPTFNEAANSIVMVSAEKDIAESLFIILSTIPGERIMRPEFGCDLHSKVFARVDSTFKHDVVDLISTAISEFEPRVELDTIDIDTSEVLDGIVNIHIYYTIISVNVRTNIVYPFYIVEGTGVSDME